MTDPEASLNVKLKRSQFNHRIPVQIVDMFEEFGDDKKYLLEYLLWIACRHLGSKYLDFPKWEMHMLEEYFDNIKAHLKENEKFSGEFTALVNAELDLQKRLEDVLKRKASDFAINSQD